MPTPKYGRGAPTVQAPEPSTEQNEHITQAPPDLGTRLLAGGLRIGGQLLATPAQGLNLAVPGLGTAAAFGLGAGSDLLAQGVEEGKFNQFDPESMARAGIEGATAAVPLGWLFKGGKLIQTAARSGAAGAIGEAGREYARNEDIKPGSIASAGLWSGLFGGTMAKFMPGMKGTNHPEHGPETIDKFVRQQNGDLTKIAKTASTWEKEGMPEAAQGLRVAAMKTGFWDPKRIRMEIAKAEAAGDDVSAQGLRVAALEGNVQDIKIAEDAAAFARVKKAQETAMGELKRAEAAGMKPTKSIGKSVSGVDPETGKKIQVSEKLTKPKGPKGAGPAGADPLPPAGSPVRAIYEEWLSVGRDPETALKLTIQGLKPTDVAKANAAARAAEAAAAEAATSKAVPPASIEPPEAPPMSGLRMAGPEPPPQAVAPVAPPGVVAAALPEQAPPGIVPEAPVAPPVAPPAVATPGAPPLLQSVSQAQPWAPVDLAGEVAEQGKAAQGAAKAATLTDPVIAAASDAQHAAMVERMGGTSPVPEPRDMSPMNRRGAQSVPRAGGRRSDDLPAGTPGVPEAQPSHRPVEAPAAQAPQVAGKAAVAAEVAPPPPPPITTTTTPRGTPLPTPSAPPVPPPLKLPKETVTALKGLGYTPGIMKNFDAEQVQDILATGRKAPALTVEEQIAITDKVIRESYAEVPELAERIANLSALYRKAKAAGDPQAAVLGAALQAEGKAAEQEGLIAEGFAKAVSKDINDTMDDIIVQKMWEGSKQAIPEGGMAPIRVEPTQSALLPGRTPPTPQAPEPPPTARVGEMTGDTAVKMQALRDKAAAIANDMTMSQPMKDAALESLNQEANAMQKELLQPPPRGPAPEAPPIAGEAPPVKPEGGVFLGAGLGALQGFMEQHPQLATRLAGGVWGGIAGGVIDPLGDPFTSAIVGAGAGMAGPEIVKGIKALGGNPNDPDIAQALNNPKGAEELSSTVYHLLPHIQRFNYLASAHGLAANAIAGPYGSGLFSLLPKALTGDRRAWEALKEMTPGNWGQTMHASWQEGIDLIRNVEHGSPMARAELHGPGLEALPETARMAIQFPAYAMAAGDLATRKILLKHGFTQEEAKDMTLTAEPFLPLLKKLVNLRRGAKSPLMELVFPFVRTPANIAEQAAVRTPGLGFIAQHVREKHGAETVGFKEQAVQQGLSVVVAYASFAMGSNMSPEQAKIARRYITNAAGPYSAIAALGFAAGQANARGGGNKGLMESMAEPEVGREFEYALPFPTARPITETFGYLSGNRKNPDGSRKLPSGMVPGFITDMKDDTSGLPVAPKMNVSKPTLPGKKKYGR